MTNVYIFAPSLTHANMVVQTQSLQNMLASDGELNFVPLKFSQTLGTRFRDGDWVLIRGLKSINDVRRMKYIVDNLVHCAAMSECFLVMGGLDNYRALSIRPQIIVELPKSLKVDKPEYDKPKSFFEELFGRK